MEMIRRIGEQEARAYFGRLDPLARPGTVLFVIGGSALTATEVPVGMVRDVVLTHYRVPEGV